MSEESDRVATFGHLENGLRHAGDWYLWGPYLSERQWGTVREDYSADGEAWDYFPHDHARSRAYRWGEDGLAGFSDIEQRLCLGLALWNGEDAILKERIFGLTGSQGNHGEDAKEYWWYLDALPSHAWNRWRYHYPQRAFPYEDLVAENGRRNRQQPEYELLDTGAFDDDRFWIVEVHYAKADEHDVLMRIRVTNAAAEAAELHVLPTVWFRNTWSWDEDAEKPELRLAGPGRIELEHPFEGAMELLVGDGPAGPAELLFCENETNDERLFGTPNASPYPKDGINDHVLHGAATVNPEQRGTKAAAWHRVTVAAGDTVELRVRLRVVAERPKEAAPLGAGFERVMNARRADADEYYAELTPEGTPPAEADVMRQAFAGMLWSKQLFAYDVRRWLDGDPTMPPPPESRLTGRNSRWKTFDAFDLMSMPDTWEYPWFAAWDMAFHCVALAHVDPAFAKYQLLLLCREWFQHPNGAMAAYEWNFDDVNPPVQAWAALEVFAIDGAQDHHFLERIFGKLLVNFTWWINREDADGSNLFEGGFLGLDNIGPLDRSKLPVAGRLEQSDATAWMAFYAIDMATMASLLRNHGRPYEDLVLKFMEHFTQIRLAMEGQDLWDDDDGFFYDRLILPDGSVQLIKVRNVVGILPLLACVVLGEGTLRRAANVDKAFARIVRNVRTPEELQSLGLLKGEPGNQRLFVGVVDPARVQRVFERLFDPEEFLSPYGIRAVSRYHRDHPYVLEVEGLTATIDYEPAESTTAMFGGNSNWRGPIWFPVNYLLVNALDRLGQFYGEDLTVEYPKGSGVQHTVTEIAEDLRDRLIAIFLRDADGNRPSFGGLDRFQHDPRWGDNIFFNEYFHGDNGAGLGATHQTGWTGIVADLIRRKHQPVPTTTELVEEAIRNARP